MCLDPPSGGDFVPPSCADRAHFLRFSVLQKALRYKKLEVRGLASADCSKPRSARPGSAAFSRDDLSLNHCGEEKASRELRREAAQLPASHKRLGYRRRECTPILR